MSAIEAVKAIHQISFGTICDALPLHCSIQLTRPTGYDSKAEILPAERSLHASAATEEYLYIFGGFDGRTRYGAEA